MQNSMKLKHVSLSILIALGMTACADMSPLKSVKKEVTLKPVMESVIMPFTGETVDSNVIARDGSTLSMSDSRYIMGERSLQWEWTAGSAFVIKQPIELVTDTQAAKAWGRRSTQVLSFWIYNEEAIDDDVVVDLGRGLTGTAAADAGFSINMNFTGWRAVGVSLANDIEGREVEGLAPTDSSDGEGLGSSSLAGSVRNDMDTIRFTAPRSIEQGRFYIDRVMLSVDDARYQWSDDQVKTRYDIPEIDFKLAKEPIPASAEGIAAAKTIEQSLIDVFTKINGERGLKVTNDIQPIRDSFNRLRIERDSEGNLSGRHIITGKQKVIYQPEFMKAEDKVLFDDYVTLAEYSTLLFNIGRSWHNTQDEAVKTELADMYVLMTEHILDQGFVDGSSLVTTHHWGYSSRWWYISAMLMSDVLTEHNLRQPIYDSLLWYSREFKANFDMVPGLESSDLDYFNTLSRQHLALLMLEPNIDRRVELLEKFGKYIDIALSQVPPGGYDGLRPDGTAWRHEGNYPGYSFPAFKNAAQLVYMLNDTPFEVGEAGRQALKKAMMSAWVYSNPEVGLGLSGRHPLNPPKLAVFQDSYRWLALSGDLVGDGQIDNELAAVYLQVTGKTAEQSVALFGERVEPKSLPQGNWAFNGGAFGIHRYQDKMVTMKGYNSNVWSSEIYYRDNRYGRYQSHGAVQVVPYGKQADIGFVEDGWDWNRNPGATTIHLSLDQLESPNSHTLMLRGQQPFSGASSLAGQYGMFAFKHQAPSMAKFDSNFTARKTTFAIDNQLVMLGNDINSSFDNSNVETTLFQHAITAKSPAIWVNGEEITSLPYQASLKQGDWLIDGQGNGYLLVSDSNLEVRRQHQASKHNKTKAPTEGDFSVAWINHGTDVDDGEYEFLTVLDATPDAMLKLASAFKAGEKPYTVLRKDNSAHVVRNEASKVTGYAAFDATSFEDGPIVSVSKPAIVMTQELGGGEMIVSGVTPDLNMTRYTAAKPTQVPVTVSGHWQAKEANENVSVAISGDNTSLSFTSYFGIPQEIVLIKK